MDSGWMLVLTSHRIPTQAKCILSRPPMSSKTPRRGRHVKQGPTSGGPMSSKAPIRGGHVKQGSTRSRHVKRGPASGGKMSSKAPSASTRERIIDEAMLLFSDHGYAGTSVAKIEKAAGLTPGAGGLYHHFESKEAVLAAGIARRLARLQALRDIRRVLTPLDDVKAELTLIARYTLTELDSEAELLRILASETRNRPQLLTSAVQELVSSTFEDFSTWIAARAQGSVAGEQASAIATIGLASLFGARLMRDLLGVEANIDDEALVDTWVQLMLGALGAS